MSGPPPRCPRLGVAFSLAFVAACHRPPVAIAPIADHSLVPTRVLPQDSTPKEDVRLMPAEAYLRMYLHLFGSAPPVDVQKRARGNDGAALFDNWGDYLSAMGFPDYRNDLPRGTQTNGLMMAAFDRLGMALCVRAAEHDLRDATPVRERLVFAFAGIPTPNQRPAFTAAFDTLHRTFLGYPARLAPPGRIDAFYEMFSATVTRHGQPGTARFRLTPVQAGWMSVCLALVRHPEFQTY